MKQLIMFNNDNSGMHLKKKFKELGCKITKLCCNLIRPIIRSGRNLNAM
jgi:hypothetical protein